MVGYTFRMDILNIGGLELLFLAGLAIIIVGPSRAAQMAGEIGRLVARARRAINAVTDDLQAQAREETEPLRSTRDSLRDLERDLRNPLDLSQPRPAPGRTEQTVDESSNAEQPTDSASQSGQDAAPIDVRSESEDAR